MRRQRVLASLLAPISLVVLVVALGVLQYKWVGQASETDRAQLRASVERRAEDFAKDFDLELDRTYRAFRTTEGFTPANGEAFARLHEDYRTTSRFPSMLRAVYYVEVNDKGLMLHRYDPDARAFAVAEWPESMAPIKLRLEAQRFRPPPAVAPGTITISTGAIFADVPALVIPENDLGTLQRVEASRTQIEELAKGAYNMMMTASHGRNHVIAELDPGVIIETVLPALAARHFEDTGADQFRVSIVNHRGDPLLTRGLTDKPLTLKDADTFATFFRLRQEFARTATVVPTGNGEARTSIWQMADSKGGAMAEVQLKVPAPPAGRGGTATFSSAELIMARPAEADRLSLVVERTSGVAAGAVTRLPAGWTVMLQHAAGSLDAAVARARRRNLYLSFGILGVLAASAGLVMVNARRSEKLAAQQMDFVATVSHELRTPLAVIRSAAQNLSAGVIGEPAQARKYGELIESEGRRLTDMVEQVLEYAGISGNRRPLGSRPVDLPGLVRDVVATSQELPEAADVTFEVRTDDGLPMVMADEDATRRAILNLVGNALKYAADGGWVGLTVSRGTGREDGYVRMEVADRGRGIPAEDLPHIFEPFYRGQYARDRQIHGNGLGLSLVKRIVESQGGRVTVRSSPGQGTTFVLSLPVAAGAVAATPAAAAPPLSVPHARGTSS